MRMLPVLISVLIGVALPSQAQITEADIVAYNAALQAGDASMIQTAAMQLANGAMSDPDNPDSGIAAYEAAWTLCRTGACEQALPAAMFAAGLPGATAQDRLLSAFAAWKVQSSSSNARTLQAALNDAAPLAPSGMSVSAFREFYGARLLSRDYAGAERLAKQAQSHFALGGEPFQRFEFEARGIAITSRFNSSPRAAQVEEMVHLRGELSQLRRAAGRDRPDWMNDAYWLANAWQNAMQAYFVSTDRRFRAARMEEILAGYEGGAAPIEVSEAAEGEAGTVRARFCEGEMVQQPAMRYPVGQGMRGRFGSVIVKFRFEDGKVRDPEVLAAVPSDGFREDALRTVSQWYFRPSEDPVQSGCRLDHNSVIQEFVFALG
ncbi:MAG: energy transducer TonB [Hyphomonas sp.]